ncbi:zinc finger protein 665-like [Periplaneta americana]|uniref:zinc finger protein 665-like n=1 Tax=Periplaneta americana TaxID=6978 RepID=UPI0037E749E1
MFEKEVLMDVIKTEPEDIDPLAVADIGEANPSPTEDNSLTPPTMDSIDTSHAIKWEVKTEEISAPLPFSMVKCELDEEKCDMITIKEENKLEVSREEESEFITDSSFRPDEDETSEVKFPTVEALVSENPDRESDPQSSDPKLSKKNNSHTESCRRKDKPFKCEVCGKFLQTLHNLNTHFRLHVGDKKLRCDTCGKTFPKSGKLIAHIRTHTGEKPFKCEVCGKCFSTPGHLTLHTRTHTGEKPYECDVCGKCFSRSEHLKDHVRIHTGEKPFKCDVCGIRFTHLRSLSKHAPKHIIRAITLEHETYKEENRRRRIGSAEGMDVIKTEPEVDPLDLETSDNTDMDNNKPSTEEGNSLDVHVAEIKTECTEDSYDHTPEIKDEEETTLPTTFVMVKCEAEEESCDVDTVEQEKLKPFKCDVCGNGFWDWGELRMHTRVHTGEKPFSCVYCGKDFSRLGSLNTHARVHTGEKPFECSDCGKRFSHSSNLKMHERKHTGEKPFKCDVCGKCFPESGHLKRHTRVHTGERPFKCEICGKCFTQSGSLTTHLRVHTGEKPFRCDVCDKCFSVSGHLRRHAILHTEKKSAICTTSSV